jgi:hypothetical protein
MDRNNRSLMRVAKGEALIRYATGFPFGRGTMFSIE